MRCDLHKDSSRPLIDMGVVAAGTHREETGQFHHMALLCFHLVHTGIRDHIWILTCQGAMVLDFWAYSMWPGVI